MTDLFVDSETGKVPIENSVSRKYRLEKGTTTPFTRRRVVGPKGDSPPETSMAKDPKNHTSLENEKAEGSEDVMLSTSEIIDFSQGTDSDTGQ